MQITTRHDPKLRTTRRALRVMQEAAALEAVRVEGMFERGDCTSDALAVAQAARQVADAIFTAAVFAPHPEVTHIEVMVDAR